MTCRGQIKHGHSKPKHINIHDIPRSHSPGPVEGIATARASLDLIHCGLMNIKECKGVKVEVIERVYHDDAGFAPGAPGQSEVRVGSSAEFHLNVDGFVFQHLVGGVNTVEQPG